MEQEQIELAKKALKLVSATGGCDIGRVYLAALQGYAAADEKPNFAVLGALKVVYEHIQLIEIEPTIEYLYQQLTDKQTVQ